VKPTLYMETSVVSYLAARNSREPILAGQQASTHRWWKDRRRFYEVFISKLVWQEASRGDKSARERRLKFIKPFRWLQVTSQVMKLTHTLVATKAVPANAADDAIHIALGAVYGMNFLLTWNFTHINNPATEEEIRGACKRSGFHCPVICTPDQLLST
jgi:predicted nucleic acid-binding protein